MTNEKARDFFSAYYEGTLEPGLSQSFESKLRTDNQLSSEYRSFMEAMESLDVLKLEEIAVPADLNERIAARLDKAIYDRSRSNTPKLSLWLRNLAFAGLAAAAVVGAVMSFNGRGEVAASGVAPVTSAPEATFKRTDQGLYVKVSTDSGKSVIVTDAEGKELQRSSAGATEFDGVLRNENKSAAAFGLEVLGDSTRFVALPGQAPSPKNVGEGSMLDLAKSAADFFRTPVVIKVKLNDESVRWSFDSSDPVAELSKALGSRFQVTLTAEDVIQIDQN